MTSVVPYSLPASYECCRSRYCTVRVPYCSGSRSQEGHITGISLKAAYRTVRVRHLTGTRTVTGLYGVRVLYCITGTGISELYTKVLVHKLEYRTSTRTITVIIDSSYEYCTSKYENQQYGTSTSTTESIPAYEYMVRVQPNDPQPATRLLVRVRVSALPNLVKYTSTVPYRSREYGRVRNGKDLHATDAPRKQQIGLCARTVPIQHCDSVQIYSWSVDEHAHAACSKMSAIYSYIGLVKYKEFHSDIDNRLWLCAGGMRASGRDASPPKANPDTVVKQFTLSVHSHRTSVIF